VDKTLPLWLDDLNVLPVHEHVNGDGLDADQCEG
jgi:hypothetical protein